MKYIKRVFKAILYIFKFPEELKKKAVDDGLCDFSGQGRDLYGR